MSKALAVSLSIALAAGNTPIGTRYVSAQENPAVWEAQTTAEGEAVTSGRSVEEDTGTNVGGRNRRNNRSFFRKERRYIRNSDNRKQNRRFTRCHNRR